MDIFFSLTQSTTEWRHGRVGEVRSKVFHTVIALKEIAFPPCPDLLKRQKESISVGDTSLNLKVMKNTLNRQKSFLIKCLLNSASISIGELFYHFFTVLSKYLPL